MCFPVKFAKILRNSFLQSISGACFWKYLMNPFFIAFENNEWGHFVVRIGSPAFISFFCVCFLSFFLVFFFVCVWILLLFDFEASLSILKQNSGVVPRFRSGFSRSELLQPYLVQF